MITLGKPALAVLVALAASTALVAPSGATPSAPDRTSKHTVNGKKLCKSFGKSTLTCTPGYASSAGTETHYDAVARAVDAITGSTVLMSAKHTTCGKVTLSFFVEESEDTSRLTVKTVNGKYPVETTGTNIGTVTAKVSRKPFKVVVTVPAPGTLTGPFTDFYISAQGSCRSATGK